MENIIETVQNDTKGIEPGNTLNKILLFEKNNRKSLTPEDAMISFVNSFLETNNLYFVPCLIYDPEVRTSTKELGFLTEAPETINYIFYKPPEFTYTFYPHKIGKGITETYCDYEQLVGEMCKTPEGRKHFPSMSRAYMLYAKFSNQELFRKIHLNFPFKLERRHRNGNLGLCSPVFWSDHGYWNSHLVEHPDYIFFGTLTIYEHKNNKNKIKQHTVKIALDKSILSGISMSNFWISRCSDKNLLEKHSDVIILNNKSQITEIINMVYNKRSLLDANILNTGDEYRKCILFDNIRGSYEDVIFRIPAWLYSFIPVNVTSSKVKNLSLSKK